MIGAEFGGPMANGPQARAARLAAFIDDRLGMEACDEASLSRALLLVAEQDGMDEVAKRAAWIRRHCGDS